MNLHKITEFYTEWFSIYPSVTTKLRTTAMFKSFVRQNNDSNKTYMNAHNLLMYQT
jgi:hypothetical protein